MKVRTHSLGLNQGRAASAARARVWLPWAGLVGGVLAAHYALLTQARLVFDVHDTPTAQTWVTRNLVMAPTQATPQVPAPVARPAALRRAARPRAHAVPDVHAGPPAGAADEPLPPVDPAPADPDPAVSAPVEAQASVEPSVPEATPTQPDLVQIIQNLRPTAVARPVTPTALALEMVASARASAEAQGGASPTVTLPGSTRLLYTLTGESRGQTYHARGELLWRHDGQAYEARLEVSAFLIGSRAQTSRGRLGPSGLVPERFGDKFRSEQAAHFDWERARVVFSANTPEAALVPGAQDRLSVMLQLAARVAGEPGRYRPGTQLEQQTVSARESEVWTLLLESEEMLQLPGGELRALKWLRQPRRPFDQRVEVWLAPRLGYLPARIRITQANGDFIDQQWNGSEAP